MTEPASVPAQTPGWVADDSTFGARLALIRQRMGWGNIAKAAKECGVPTDSWRNWEVDGREPHRLTTIAMTIAGATGCDYLWLVHGPARGGVRSGTGLTSNRGRYDVGQRVLARETPAAHPAPDTRRSVRQTRPMVKELQTAA